MIRRPIFSPILAGATLSDRLLACAGAGLGIALTALAAWGFLLLLPNLALASLPLVVAPMGASAVLVFAVPASPLAQPWPVIGGNVISALVGVTVAHWVPNMPLAAGLAVALAILAMSLSRSLHPPGGAAALSAVIGGPAVFAAGYEFPFLPIGLNALVLVAAGLLYHRFSGHSYPHRPVPVAGHAVPAPSLIPHPEDIDKALEDLGESFDVAREDLDLLFAQVERHAAARRAAARR
ncbi:MAG: HPP family protein [Methylobacterium mesophilicum]|nr:HPP family protein [Methylobacterium mesophilicum]